MFWCCFWWENIVTDYTSPTLPSIALGNCAPWMFPLLAFSVRVNLFFSISPETYFSKVLLSPQVFYIYARFVHPLFKPIRTSEHMASFGVFGLIQVFAFFGYLRAKLGAESMAKLFWSLIAIVAMLGVAGIVCGLIPFKFINDTSETFQTPDKKCFWQQPES